MEPIIYKYKISPEVLKSDIVEVTVNNQEFGVYSGMTQILSGGTDGSSLLTGLTIPIMFTQTYNDLGYYSPFDGLILQKDVITNFLYSADTTNRYKITLYNTSQESLKSFLQFSDYIVDWGDGSERESLNVNINVLIHTYPEYPKDYTITLLQKNPWGTVAIEKPIFVPQTGVTITNPLGNIVFTPQGGNWSGTPTNYNFIFTGDSNNTVEAQISSNFTTVPFLVTGYTQSQLKDLKSYGPNPYDPSNIISKNGEFYGQILNINPSYTSYTINNINYFDYPDRTTFFMVESSGITSSEIISTGITKQEVLLDFVSSPEIQSEVFIERGKQSAFEGLQRLGEVDNLGDLVRYGYGFYKINNQ
jgi:hypothetical protein